MREFRVTKYDPDLRDQSGAFLREEWTSVSDVGRTFLGTALSLESYRAVELAYTNAVLHFLEEAEVDFLRVYGVENHGNADGIPQEGSVVERVSVPAVVGAMLREEFWCRLESREAFVHVGNDYYLYIGVSRECPNSVKFAQRQGLFVERFISPYHPDVDA
jgi:hypothetical protein